MSRGGRGGGGWGGGGGPNAAGKMGGQALPWEFDPDLESRLSTKPSEKFPVSFHFFIFCFFWTGLCVSMSLSFWLLFVLLVESIPLHAFRRSSLAPPPAFATTRERHHRERQHGHGHGQYRTTTLVLRTPLRLFVERERRRKTCSANPIAHLDNGDPTAPDGNHRRLQPQSRPQ